MAKNKKSFVLYCDLIHTIEKMPSDKAGDLFKHILRYVNDLDPVTDDLLVELTFEPLKQQLKRDLVKYFKTCERNQQNGLNGGRKSKENPKEPSGLINNPVGLNETHSNPKQPDSDNDNDNDILKGNLIDFETSKKEAFNNYTMRNKICRLYNVSEKQVDELLNLFFEINEVDYPKTWNDTEKHILRWSPYNIGKCKTVLPESENKLTVLPIDFF